MKQSGIYKLCNIENSNTANAYSNLGLANDTKEEQIKCYKEAIRIYKQCNIENAETAHAYYNLGKASDTKEEKRKYLQ